MTLRMMLLALTLTFGVGCSGKQKIADLESQLAECNEARTALEGENGDLKDANAKLTAEAQANAELAAARKQLYDDLTAQLKELIDAGTLTVTIRNGLIVLQMPNKVLFDSGKAVVKKDSRETVGKVAQAIKNIKNRRFFVSGHTDNRPIKEKADQFKDNWDLSSQRAYNVHLILKNAGVREANLAVAGFADTDPLADNGTDEGKAQNRRIEIIVMPDLTNILPAIAKAQSSNGES